MNSQIVSVPNTPQHPSSWPNRQTAVSSTLILANIACNVFQFSIPTTVALNLSTRVFSLTYLCYSGSWKTYKIAIDTFNLTSYLGFGQALFFNHFHEVAPKHMLYKLFPFTDLALWLDISSEFINCWQGFLKPQSIKLLGHFFAYMDSKKNGSSSAAQIDSLRVNTKTREGALEFLNIPPEKSNDLSFIQDKCEKLKEAYQEKANTPKLSKYIKEILEQIIRKSDEACATLTLELNGS